MSSAYWHDIELIGGRVSGRCPPVWSRDERFLFITSDSGVLVFSVATGELVRVLRGHRGDTSSCVLNPRNELQIFTGSLDGVLRLWDYTEAEVLKEYTIGRPILDLVVDPLHPNRLFVLCRTQSTLESGRVIGSVLVCVDTNVAIEGNIDESSRSDEDIDEDDADDVDDGGGHSIIASPPSSLFVKDSLSVSNRRVRSTCALRQGVPIWWSRKAVNVLCISPVGTWLVLRQRGDAFFYLVTLDGDTLEEQMVDEDSSATNVSMGLDASQECATSDASHTFDRVNNGKPISSVVFHPSKHVVAYSDVLGTIRLVWDYDFRRTQKLSWHQSVNALEFTPDGLYLLSGGGEAVLVLWNIERASKDFLPRLGAPVDSIAPSPGGTYYAVALHADDCIKIIDAASMKQKQMIQGFKLRQRLLHTHHDEDEDGNGGGRRDGWSHHDDKGLDERGVMMDASHGSNTGVTRVRSSRGGGGAMVDLHHAQRVGMASNAVGLHVQPVTGHVVTMGRPGSLQFFDVKQRRPLQELQVSPPLNVQDPGKKGSHCVVAACSFSSDGETLVTFDTRIHHRRYPQEVQLKFWTWSARKHHYHAITTVAYPSTSPRITGLDHHPVEHMVASCVSNNEFRLWRRIRLDASSNAATKTTSGTGGGGGDQPPKPIRYSWTCTSVHRYRNALARSLQFSSDGSLLAVAFDEAITLWDPVKPVLLRTVMMSIPSSMPHMRMQHCQRLLFVPDTPFLLVVFPDFFFVWHALCAKVWYSFRCVVTAIAARSGMFAIGLGGHLLLFDPRHPEPRFVWTLKGGAHCTPSGISFLPSSPPSNTTASGSSVTGFFGVREPGLFDDAQARAFASGVSLVFTNQLGELFYVRSKSSSSSPIDGDGTVVASTNSTMVGGISSTTSSTDLFVAPGMENGSSSSGEFARKVKVQSSGLEDIFGSLAAAGAATAAAVSGKGELPKVKNATQTSSSSSPSSSDGGTTTSVMYSNGSQDLGGSDHHGGLDHASTVDQSEKGDFTHHVKADLHMFAGPSHAIPSLAKVFRPFMSTLLLPHSEEQGEGSPGIDDGGDNTPSSRSASAAAKVPKVHVRSATDGTTKRRTTLEKRKRNDDRESAEMRKDDIDGKPRDEDDLAEDVSKLIACV